MSVDWQLRNISWSESYILDTAGFPQLPRVAWIDHSGLEPVLRIIRRVSPGHDIYV